MLKYIARNKDLRHIPIISKLRLGVAEYLVKLLSKNELLNLWTHVWWRRRMVKATMLHDTGCLRRPRWRPPAARHAMRNCLGETRLDLAVLELLVVVLRISSRSVPATVSWLHPVSRPVRGFVTASPDTSLCGHFIIRVSVTIVEMLFMTAW